MVRNLQFKVHPATDRATENPQIIFFFFTLKCIIEFCKEYIWPHCVTSVHCRAEEPSGEREREVKLTSWNCYLVEGLDI